MSIGLLLGNLELTVLSSCFSTRMMWRAKGEGELYLVSSASRLVNEAKRS